MANDNVPHFEAAQAPPLVLMELQVNTLFQCDGYDRLMSVNEPGNKQAPRFFLGRTPAGNLLRLRHDLPRDLAKELETLAAREPLPYDLKDPPREQFPIMHALRRHGAVVEDYRGPAYVFAKPIPRVGGVVLVEPQHANRLHPSLATLGPELIHRQPCLAVVEDGCAVSVCYSARTGPRGVEAGVETAPPYRGRGHALRATAAWARAIQQRGLVALYSTTWDNVPSLAIAKRHELRLYGEDWHVR
jgi:hypothetical protein